MTTESGLSGDCELVLHKWDMNAEPDFGGKTSGVFDEDGMFLFRVSKNIDPSDLLAMLRYGEHRFKGGIQRGKEELAASLRALIGAAGRDDE